MIRRAAMRVWRWPVVMAVLLAIGLAAALLGQGGVWWGVSWLALAVPLATIAVALLRARPASNASRRWRN